MSQQIQDHYIGDSGFLFLIVKLKHYHLWVRIPSICLTSIFPSSLIDVCHVWTKDFNGPDYLLPFCVSHSLLVFPFILSLTNSLLMRSLHRLRRAPPWKFVRPSSLLTPPHHRRATVTTRRHSAVTTRRSSIFYSLSRKAV
jgi:hypothetical protein